MQPVSKEYDELVTGLRHSLKKARKHKANTASWNGSYPLYTFATGSRGMRKFSLTACTAACEIKTEYKNENENIWT